MLFGLIISIVNENSIPSSTIRSIAAVRIISGMDISSLRGSRGNVTVAFTGIFFSIRPKNRTPTSAVIILINSEGISPENEMLLISVNVCSLLAFTCPPVYENVVNCSSDSVMLFMLI
jgi:hypothetical protein